MTLGHEVEQLVAEHGLDIVRDAIRFLPRLIALIKAGKLRRITVALDEAHAKVDALADQAQARIRDAGEA